MCGAEVDEALASLKGVLGYEDEPRTEGR